MIQIMHNKKEVYLQELSPIFISIFNDNLENYRFPDLKLEWVKNKENISSSIVLQDDKIKYLIENHNKYANVFLLISKDENPMITKEDVKKSLNKLNLHDQEIWFNEWYFLPSNGLNLKNEIANWINENISNDEMKKRTKKMTSLSDKEVKNLLCSHDLLIGSIELQQMYPNE